MEGRIPIVLGACGQWEQLQPGDDLLATLHVMPGAPKPASFVFRATSYDFAAFAVGQVAAINPSGTGVQRAIASDIHAAAVAMAQYVTNPGEPGWFQVGGLFELLDWSEVIGAVQLWPRGVYFLDDVHPGKLTRVVPTTPGHISQEVGVTVTPTTMLLTFMPTILL